MLSDVVVRSEPGMTDFLRLTNKIFANPSSTLLSLYLAHIYKIGIRSTSKYVWRESTPVD